MAQLAEKKEKRDQTVFKFVSFLLKKQPTVFQPLQTELQTLAEEFETVKTCNFELARGPRSGQKCGKKAEKGSSYCSTHLAFENEMNETLKTFVKSHNKRKENQITDSKENQASDYRVFKKHKALNVFYNDKTGFVLRSKSDRTVVGKVVGDSCVERLDNQDKDVCKRLLMPFAE
jgi:hypothetical protein